MTTSGNRFRRLPAAAALGLALATTLGSIAMQGTGDRKSGGPSEAALRRSECYIPGLPRPAECVTLDVPLDWDAPEGTSIEVTAVVISAIEKRRPDPLFVLPGGPGQGASTYGGLVGTAFGEIYKHRDIVLVDPRGTGMSTAFNCEVAADATGSLTKEQRVEAGRLCAAQAPADPRFFTAREVVEDVERLRSELGYGSISLWGGSFGTRLAQFYIAAHGDRVRAAIFDGPVPTTNLFVTTVGPDADETTKALYGRCAEEAGCAARFPRGMDELVEVLASFDVPRAVRYADPLTDTVVEIRLDRDAVAEAIRGGLYVPSHAAMIPLVVDALARGDAEPLAALRAETAGWSTSTQQVGAMMAVMCIEEAAEFAARSPEVADVPLFGDGYSRFFLDFCATWPARRLPSSVRYPEGHSPVPALILSGAMDPVANPRRGEELAARFTTHVNLVVHNGGHINSARGCAPQLLAAFLDRPGAPVDGSCLDDIAWPPFALSTLGPVALR